MSGSDRVHLVCRERHVWDGLIRGKPRLSRFTRTAAQPTQGGPWPRSSPRWCSRVTASSFDRSPARSGGTRSRRPPSFSQASSAAEISSSRTWILLDVVLDRVPASHGGVTSGGTESGHSPNLPRPRAGPHRLWSANSAPRTCRLPATTDPISRRTSFVAVPSSRTGRPTLMLPGTGKLGRAKSTDGSRCCRPARGAWS